MMNPFKWFRKQRSRYYRAMMMLTQAEYWERSGDERNPSSLNKYFKYKHKYENSIR